MVMRSDGKVTSPNSTARVQEMVDKALGLDPKDQTTELVSLRIQNEINKGAAEKANKALVEARAVLRKYEKAMVSHLKYCDMLETDLSVSMEMVDKATAALEELAHVEIDEMVCKKLCGQDVPHKTGVKRSPAKEAIEIIKQLEKQIL